MLLWTGVWRSDRAGSQRLRKRILRNDQRALRRCHCVAEPNVVWRAKTHPAIRRAARGGAVKDGRRTSRQRRAASLTGSRTLPEWEAGGGVGSWDFEDRFDSMRVNKSR